MAPIHVDLDEFGRAVNINQLWYSSSSQALRSDPGISRHKQGNGYYYVIDNRLVLRFKHFDDGYRSRNHPTPRFRAWDSQMPFPTLPPLVKLDLGYRLDLTGTRVLDAMIVLNFNRLSVWRWQIWGRRIDEFAATPRDMQGRLVYVHDDYSGVSTP